MPARQTDISGFPLRNPLIAGACVLGVFALGAGAIALLAPEREAAVSARAMLDLPERAPEIVEIAVAEAARPVIFEETPEEDGLSLPGVREAEDALGGEVQPPPGSNAARALAAPRAPQAPLPGLSEPGPGGPLPVIGPDGTRPSLAYARPFAGDSGAPAIAIIVGGLGVSESLTEAAIDNLPPEITLSFVPYARNLQSWIDRARTAGHEVMIELPMEPFDYPNNDPGPHTLMAEASQAENARRLHWLLSRGAGYFGVTNYLGARLATSETALAAIYRELSERGLAVFHDGAGRRGAAGGAARRAGTPLVIADRLLDTNPSARAIDERLLELEALALQNGTALGSGFAYPVTVGALQRWAQGLEARGYQLAPASHVARQRAGHDGRDT
ncbi:MAG: divergent polysaccharide deacetylase family protein [Glycocaulis sp.]